MHWTRPRVSDSEPAVAEQVAGLGHLPLLVSRSPLPAPAHSHHSPQSPGTSTPTPLRPHHGGTSGKDGAPPPVAEPAASLLSPFLPPPFFLDKSTMLSILASQSLSNH
ncbi:unnamed protein product [Closterium sp. NIES-53]